MFKHQIKGLNPNEGDVLFAVRPPSFSFLEAFKFKIWFSLYNSYRTHTLIDASTIDNQIQDYTSYL